MSPQPIELHIAFFWVCPDCGVDNFERGVFWENGGGASGASYAIAPGEVTCADCDHDFEVEGEELEITLED